MLPSFEASLLVGGKSDGADRNSGSVLKQHQLSKWCCSRTDEEFQIDTQIREHEQKERILNELMTSDRKLKASKEGLK